MSTRHPGRARKAPALTASDTAPRRADDGGGVIDKLGSLTKLGSVRQCSPAEYARIGLLATDYATTEHPAGSAAADELGAQLLDMLGLLDPRRRPDAHALVVEHRGDVNAALLREVGARA